jgi:hypothetical protein
MKNSNGVYLMQTKLGLAGVFGVLLFALSATVPVDAYAAVTSHTATNIKSHVGTSVENRQLHYV